MLETNAGILAACPHFGTCGGCIDLAPKTGRLATALIAAGYLAATERPIVTSQPNTRRRMDLAVRRILTGVELGLHRHRSHAIVPLHTCRVLHPSLVALFAPLAEILPRLTLLKRDGAVIANLLDNGPDILLRTDAAATGPDRTRLAAFAAVYKIPRISHAIGNAAPEPVTQHQTPILTLSGIQITPPPGAFLQATQSGEAAIIAAIIAALPKLPPRARIAELYAGSGTLTFPLSKLARIDAYESDQAAHAALTQACRANALLGRITPYRRDLTRQPLQPKDLAPYTALVLDPPAAGAPIQIQTIAASTLKTIIYVSCNLATLANDATHLRQAGFTLTNAQPIDQFIGAAHLESVTTFRR